MLVLKRKVKEKITIAYQGKTVEVVILGFEGQSVKLGFAGLKEFVISRSEILKKTGELEDAFA